MDDIKVYNTIFFLFLLFPKADEQFPCDNYRSFRKSYKKVMRRKIFKISKLRELLCIPKYMQTADVIFTAQYAKLPEE